MKKILTTMAVAAIAVLLSGFILMEEDAPRKDDYEMQITEEVKKLKIH